MCPPPCSSSKHTRKGKEDTMQEEQPQDQPETQLQPKPAGATGNPLEQLMTLVDAASELYDRKEQTAVATTPTESSTVMVDRSSENTSPCTTSTSTASATSTTRTVSPVTAPTVPSVAASKQTSLSTSATAFLDRLRGLLDDETMDDVVQWMPSSSKSPQSCSFQIVDTKKLKKILPVAFGLQNMSSFLRKLNQLGFQRCPCKITMNLDIFQHPNFVKSERPSQEKRPRPRMVPSLSTATARASAPIQAPLLHKATTTAAATASSTNCPSKPSLSLLPTARSESAVNTTLARKVLSDATGTATTAAQDFDDVANNPAVMKSLVHSLLKEREALLDGVDRVLASALTYAGSPPTPQYYPSATTARSMIPPRTYNRPFYPPQQPQQQQRKGGGQAAAAFYQHPSVRYSSAHHQQHTLSYGGNSSALPQQQHHWNTSSTLRHF
eukprot:CAMPEP_0178794008 /NCGR_PEP_ID=MMETSP0745-20121128/9365_1 /TAXON_ID=913974 /ORGANISM="Nitzschia punctata, Strain CCMP561" /LENGTH=439 /DNA_ID=CAMNT_0020452309 /DNA_START=219 /DNA_END=1538 /DNA_ORIENTATION=-